MQLDLFRLFRSQPSVSHGSSTPSCGIYASRLREKLSPLVIFTACVASLLAHYLLASNFDYVNYQSSHNSLRNHVKLSHISVNRTTSTSTITRDGSLSGLVHLMNSDEMIDIFRQWDSKPDIDRFLELLSPWITKGEVEIKNTTRPRIRLDCSQAKYSPVLTGRPLSGRNKTHFIVDFVMFGYDVEKLLLKFYETYDDVDVFVVYESPYTLMGTRKPLYFEQLKHEPRFARFLDKVVLIVSREEEIRPAVNATRAAFARGERGCSGETFATNLFLRKNQVVRFRDLKPSENKLKQAVLDHIKQGGKVFAIQADADELILADALHHVKHCEIRPEVQSIYAPCFSMKMNMHWLQSTYDMGCMDTPDKEDAKANEELRRHMWKGGPYLWPIEEMFQGEDNLRPKYTSKWCEHNLGYGAALHLSTFSDPMEHWLKKCGTVEHYGQCVSSVSPELVKAGRDGKITAELIFKAGAVPWCHGYNKAVHVDTLSEPARKVVRRAVPWVIRENPESFPFILPLINSPSAGLFSQCADVSWTSKACPTTYNWPLPIAKKQLQRVASYVSNLFKK